VEDFVVSTLTVSLEAYVLLTTLVVSLEEDYDDCFNDIFRRKLCDNCTNFIFRKSMAFKVFAAVKIWIVVF
jgi:hypothetical protein